MTIIDLRSKGIDIGEHKPVRSAVSVDNLGFKLGINTENTEGGEGQVSTLTYIENLVVYTRRL